MEVGSLLMIGSDCPERHKPAQRVHHFAYARLELVETRVNDLRTLHLVPVL